MAALQLGTGAPSQPMQHLYAAPTAHSQTASAVHPLVLQDMVSHGLDQNTAVFAIRNTNGDAIVATLWGFDYELQRLAQRKLSLAGPVVMPVQQPGVGQFGDPVRSPVIKHEQLPGQQAGRNPTARVAYAPGSMNGFPPGQAAGQVGMAQQLAQQNGKLVSPQLQPGNLQQPQQERPGREGLNLQFKQFYTYFQHTQQCQAPAGACEVRSCHAFKMLTMHVTQCQDPRCTQANCGWYKQMLMHLKRLKLNQNRMQLAQQQQQQQAQQQQQQQVQQQQLEASQQQLQAQQMQSHQLQGHQQAQLQQQPGPAVASSALAPSCDAPSNAAHSPRLGAPGPAAAPSLPQDHAQAAAQPQQQLLANGSGGAGQGSPHVPGNPGAAAAPQPGSMGASPAPPSQPGDANGMGAPQAGASPQVAARPPQQMLPTGEPGVQAAGAMAGGLKGGTKRKANEMEASDYGGCEELPSSCPTEAAPPSQAGCGAFHDKAQPLAQLAGLLQSAEPSAANADASAEGMPPPPLPQQQVQQRALKEEAGVAGVKRLHQMGLQSLFAGSPLLDAAIIGSGSPDSAGTVQLNNTAWVDSVLTS